MFCCFVFREYNFLGIVFDFDSSSYAITCKTFLCFLPVKQINRVNCSSNLIDLDFKFLVTQEFYRRKLLRNFGINVSVLFLNSWITRNLKSQSIKFFFTFNGRAHLFQKFYALRSENQKMLIISNMSIE